MKFCKDCKHFTPSHDELDGVCKHRKNIRANPVYGQELTVLSAWQLRHAVSASDVPVDGSRLITWGNEAPCGPDGDWWEARD